jgi:hypothetical protein
LVVGLVLLLAACGRNDSAPDSNHEDSRIVVDEGAGSLIGEEILLNVEDQVETQQVVRARTDCSELKLDHPHITTIDSNTVIKAKAGGSCVTTPPVPGMQYRLVLQLYRIDNPPRIFNQWVKVAETEHIRPGNISGGEQIATWSRSTAYVFANCIPRSRYLAVGYVYRKAPKIFNWPIPIYPENFTTLKVDSCEKVSEPPSPPPVDPPPDDSISTLGNQSR